MGIEIRPATQFDPETVADDLAWVVSEAQKVFGKTEHLFVIPALLAEVGIKFSDGWAA